MRVFSNLIQHLIYKVLVYTRPNQTHGTEYPPVEPFHETWIYICLIYVQQPTKSCLITSLLITQSLFDIHPFFLVKKIY